MAYVLLSAVNFKSLFIMFVFSICLFFFLLHLLSVLISVSSKNGDLKSGLWLIKDFERWPQELVFRLMVYPFANWLVHRLCNPGFGGSKPVWVLCTLPRSGVEGGTRTASWLDGPAKPLDEWWAHTCNPAVWSLKPANEIREQVRLGSDLFSLCTEKIHIINMVLSRQSTHTFIMKNKRQ